MNDEGIQFALMLYGGNVIINAFIDPRVTVDMVNLSTTSCAHANDTGYHFVTPLLLSGAASPLSVPYTVIPAEVDCNSTYASLTETVAHEMVEGISDPFWPLGWAHRYGVGDLNIAQTTGSGELGDICNNGAKALKNHSQPFLQGNATYYWSNTQQACEPQWNPALNLRFPVISIDFTSIVLSVIASGADTGSYDLDFGGSGFPVYPLSPSYAFPRGGVGQPIFTPYFEVQNSGGLIGGAINPPVSAGNSIRNGGDALKVTFNSWSTVGVDAKIPRTFRFTPCDEVTVSVWNWNQGSMAQGRFFVPRRPLWRSQEVCLPRWTLDSLSISRFRCPITVVNLLSDRSP